jgi:pimeloyl-ACP methyl ester carboxylesterase
MGNMEFLSTDTGRKIAYHKVAGRGPGVVFLGGFISDMAGTKAVFLEDLARRAGRAFLRFDYSGHGQSSGEFAQGCIGDWAADARAAIEALTQGPEVLVGSSMGGWISVLVCREMAEQGAERVAGLVTIAATPDFTEDSMWASFDGDQRAALLRDGQILLLSDYDHPYVISKRLIEDGRDQLVLRAPIKLPFPVRFLQGTADRDVDMAVALRLLEQAEGGDIRLTLVQGADHRFSQADNLALIVASVKDVLARIGGAL